MPESLGPLRSLQSLDLSANQISALPPGFALPAVEELDLSSNRFDRVPEQLAALPSLKSLALGKQEPIRSAGGPPESLLAPMPVR